MLPVLGPLPRTSEPPQKCSQRRADDQWPLQRPGKVTRGPLPR